MGYFEHSLIVAAVIGFEAGLVGTLVVLRRRVFFAQALTHATYPGAVMAAALGVSVPLGAAVAAGVIVAIVFGIARVRRQGTQVAAGIVLTTGFAIGAGIQAVIPGIPINPESFLVGSILTATDGDLALAAVVTGFAFIVLVGFGHRLIFATFDPVGFSAAGFRRWPLDVSVLVLIAASVIVSLPAVGAILTIALLAAPAAAARQFTKTYRGILVLAPIIGATAGALGVLASRVFAVAAGPAIVLIATAVFALGLLWSRTSRVIWSARA